MVFFFTLQTIWWNTSTSSTKCLMFFFLPSLSRAASVLLSMHHGAGIKWERGENTLVWRHWASLPVVTAWVVEALWRSVPVLHFALQCLPRGEVRYGKWPQWQSGSEGGKLLSLISLSLSLFLSLSLSLSDSLITNVLSSHVSSQR